MEQKMDNIGFLKIAIIFRGLNRNNWTRNHMKLVKCIIVNFLVMAAQSP